MSGDDFDRRLDAELRAIVDGEPRFAWDREPPETRALRLSGLPAFAAALLAALGAFLVLFPRVVPSETRRAVDSTPVPRSVIPLLEPTPAGSANTRRARAVRATPGIRYPVADGAATTGSPGELVDETVEPAIAAVVLEVIETRPLQPIDPLEVTPSEIAPSPIDFRPVPPIPVGPARDRPDTPQTTSER